MNDEERFLFTSIQEWGNASRGNLDDIDQVDFAQFRPRGENLDNTVDGSVWRNPGQADVLNFFAVFLYFLGGVPVPLLQR